MPTYDLKMLGKIDVGRKLKSELTISADELFSRFSDAAKILSGDAVELIRSAVDNDNEPRTRDQRDELETFFETVESQVGEMGFGEEEMAEREEAEEMKDEQMDQEDLTSPISEDTYDETTGAKEGKIVVDDESKETNLVPIHLSEEISIDYNHDGSEIIGDVNKKGLLKIENPSASDRLWDIDLKLENIDETSFTEDSMEVQELFAGKSFEEEYTVYADVEPEIQISEFISTVNDPETESYALTLNADNEVYIKISVSNISNNELSNVVVKKELPAEFSDINIDNQTHGDAEITEEDYENVLLWKIEKFPEDETAELEISITVNISDKNTIIRSGPIKAEYQSPLLASNIAIDKFDAYSNNSFFVIISELEEKPNTFNCQFIFQNKSDFMVRLVNADVYKKDDMSVKYLDIDPEEIPEIPASSRWESKVWQYESEENEHPEFQIKVDFFIIPDHKLSTTYSLKYEDIQLAVAALEGSITYDIEQIPSYRITPFELIGKIKNTGGAPLNEVTLVENIQENFLPPEPDSVQILFNGEPMSVPRDAIIIDPDNMDPEQAHDITIKLENLRESAFGALDPEEEMEIHYKITAQKPSQDTTYHGEAKLTANTYPPGKPLVVEAEPVDIEVIHVRRKLAKGKDIRALDEEGVYEVTLFVRNLGEYSLENYEVTDKVPNDLEYFDVTGDPKVFTTEDATELRWIIEEIPADEQLEIKYKVRSIGLAKVSTIEERT